MKRKLRLGMIGGGQGAFIGAVHRLAARIDDKYEFVAGCLSSTPAKAEESAKEIGLDLSRSYPDFKTMAEEESKREDGVEVVSIVTPNHMHASPAIEFLNKNIHVICDKPMTSTMDDANELMKAINDKVNIPIIASGGVGTLEDLYDGIEKGKADAVLAASIFHFGTYTIREAKEYLKKRGISMRITDE